MKTPLRIALAVLGLAVVPSSQASLLVYEGFDYPRDSNLNAAAGGTGMTGDWTAGGTGDAAGGSLIQNSAIQSEPTDWDGVLIGNLAAIPATGRFAGMGATGTDHLFGSRPLSPAVTATFADGSVTWISAIFSRTAATGHSKPALALGSDPLDQRAQDLNGGSAALGFGTNYNSSNGPIWAASWDASSKTTGTSVNQKLGGALGTNSQQLVVAKIEWGDTPTDPDTISVFNFGENDTGGVTEAIWNAAAKGTYSIALDQTQFDTISFGGSRFHIDEIRVGTTFDDMISDTGGASPEPLEITDIVYHKTTDEITLTWKSNPGETYGIYWSDNLTGFVPDFNHALQAHPIANRTTFGPFANPDPGARRVFLQMGLPDLENPVLNTVRGNATTITLAFSEAMHASTATDLANYTVVKDGGGSVTVTTAAFGIGPDTIELTTGSTLELNTAYTVTMNNLIDLAGRPLGSPTTGGFHTWDNNPNGVKVFILAGQSNMEGHGKANEGLDDVAGAIGSLRYEVDNDPDNYGHLVDAGGDWIARSDVQVWWRNSDLDAARNVKKGDLDIGFGGGATWIGPEYGFGWIMGDHFTEPVLVVKTAWGGKSLHADFRPPSAVAKRGGVVGPYYNGMLDYVLDVLSNLDTEFPAWAGMGYQITGFGWHQGWNDGGGQAATDYEANLVDLINDLRFEFNVPDLPTSIANTGIGGWAQANPDRLKVIDAQLAVADPLKHPEFAGTVFTAETRDYWRDATVSPSSVGYHWNHNGETHFLLGDSMGKGMINLLAP